MLQADSVSYTEGLPEEPNSPPPPPVAPPTEDSWFNGDYFQTFTGKHFYLMNPRVEDVCIEDVAHALARTCRYGGHVSVENYSVAEHSCLIAQYVLDNWTAYAPAYRRTLALRGLLHDAPEAYYGDIKRPIKHEPSIKAVLGPIFAKVDGVVFAALGVPPDELLAIKALDRRIVRDEKVQVMNGEPCKPDMAGMPPLNVAIRGLLPGAAEEWFLRLYRELRQ